MSWNELAEVIAKMTEAEKQKSIPIFVFCNGEMEMLTGIFRVGETPELDSHCEDADDFTGQTALLCGY